VVDDRGLAPLLPWRQSLAFMLSPPLPFWELVEFRKPRGSAGPLLAFGKNFLPRMVLHLCEGGPDGARSLPRVPLSAQDAFFRKPSFRQDAVRFRCRSGTCLGRPYSPFPIPSVHPNRSAPRSKSILLLRPPSDFDKSHPVSRETLI